MWTAMCYLSRRKVVTSYHDSEAEAIRWYRGMVALSISQYPFAYVPWRSIEP
jgi:hypothetical protein